MSENNFSKVMYNKAMEMLDHMKKNPDSVTEEDKNILNKLYKKICEGLGISEHSQWRVEWQVEKWFDSARKLAGLGPDEIVRDTQNVILDLGANEMLKLITGTGGTPYNANNTYVFVGTDSSTENAAQTGVLATGTNRAYAKLDNGYPTVTGRQMVFRASFNDEEGNFAWNEASIVNGIGTNAISMNRKVSPLGTKTTGIWTIQITVSLVSA